MSQTASPNADVSNSGWSAVGGSGSSLFDKINAVTPTDTTYVNGLFFGLFRELAWRLT
jgi:hypothetical protein